MASRAISEQWSSSAKTLIARAGASLTAAEAATDRPDRLYHFTDCTGLVEILRTKTLWASLATCLNDRSEVTYGVALACALFKSRTVTAEHFSLDNMKDLLDERSESRAYITSFCASTATALHWLHYGHSGSGIAVGFYSEAIQKRPFYLCPVVYKEERQVSLIRSIVETIDQSLEEFLPILTDARERARLIDVASETAADHLWMAAPRMKHVAFEAEQEWRLIAYDPKGPGVPHEQGTSGDTFFRSIAGRVVPYKKLTFDALPAFEVVLGSSCPMTQDELAILVLMEECLGGRLTVLQSTVPIRA